VFLYDSGPDAPPSPGASASPHLDRSPGLHASAVSSARPVALEHRCDRTNRFRLKAKIAPAG
jgi:hypothetical protein